MLGCLSFVCGVAQQTAQSLMFVYDPLLYNGAVATKEEVSCNMHVDKQWLNLEGSPVSFFLTASAPLSKTGLGVGAMFLHQSIGINEWSSVAAVVAYRLSLSEGYALSMSVGADRVWHSLNDAKLANVEGDASYEILSECAPWLSGQVGLWMNAPSWHVSLSTKGLRMDGDTPYESVLHANLSVSKRFPMGKGCSFCMDMMAMVAENTPVTFLVQPNVDCADRWNMGLAYEVDHYVGAFFRLSVCRNFMVGGAYSYAVNSLANAEAASSFELMVGFRLPLKEERMAWD